MSPLGNSPVFRNKKALSNLIAYVLLITITISLSVMVYGWLKFYVEEGEVEECSGNVNIVVNGYDCFAGVDGNFTIELKNKGLFNVDGFVIRVHNRSDADFGFYVLEEIDDVLKTGQSYNKTYDFPLTEDAEGVIDVTLVDVQPFVREGGKIFCKAYASQKVVCG